MTNPKGSSLVTTILSVAAAVGVGVAGYSLVNGMGGTCSSGLEAAAVSDGSTGSCCPLTETADATLVAAEGETCSAGMSACSTEKAECSSEVADATLVAAEGGTCSAEKAACSTEKAECSGEAADAMLVAAEGETCSTEKAECDSAKECDEAKECTGEDVADAETDEEKVASAG